MNVHHRCEKSYAWDMQLLFVNKFENTLLLPQHSEHLHWSVTMFEINFFTAAFAHFMERNVAVKYFCSVSKAGFKTLRLN